MRGTASSGSTVTPRPGWNKPAEAIPDLAARHLGDIWRQFVLGIQAVSRNIPDDFTAD
jgi:hypothetical protein